MGGGRPRYPANQREPHHFGFYFDVIGGVKETDVHNLKWRGWREKTLQI